MSQLGEQLRQARESRGLSLAQAAVETRIRQQALHALENGHFDMLPNDVVTKGFIRNYAHWLELPPDELIDLYRLERGSSQPIRVVPATTMPSTRSYVLPSFFGVFFVTIALVALTYVSLSAVGRISDEGSTAGVATTTTPAPATPTSLSTDIPEPDDSSAPAAASNAASNADALATPLATSPTPTSPAAGGARASIATPIISPTPEAPIVLEVSVPPGDGEGSWLRVQTDGAVAYEQIMVPGERQVFLAQRQVDVRAGNPTFVQVSVNGLPPEFLGQVAGEPVDWSWPPR